MGRKLASPHGEHKSVMEHNQWRQAVQGYLASISFADAQVGRLLDAFDSSSYAKNTTIVLWSDHGHHLGEKLHWGKWTLWEEATRNVFIIVSPGLTKAGGRCSRPVSLIDVYPTLIDICGLPPRRGLDGVSLMPLLRDPNAPWDRAALTTHGRGDHSVRSELWRYIRYRDASEELYDHQKDELEWYNLAARPEYKAVKDDLARWLPRVDASEARFQRTIPKRGPGAGSRE